MKFSRRALCVLLIAVCRVHAQQDVQDSVDDFKPTDDDNMIMFTQKFAVKLGFRGLSGAKSSFSGHGLISSVLNTDAGTGLVARTYHDGAVLLDARTAVDPSGAAVPIADDGKTNTWSFTNDSQAAINGLIAMHTYSADVIDGPRAKNLGSSFGVELSVEREMGQLFGSRVKWGLIGGMSVNQIFAGSKSTMAGTITTTTDYYSLFGQSVPAAPYSAPVLAGSVDNSVLLGNQPVKRDVTTVSSPVVANNNSRLRGAYMTFRAGPTIFVPITARFSGTFSAGLALVYAGSTYEVTQTFQPQTGPEIDQTIRDGASAILPGFYADADLQFAMNDTAGLYLGAVYQSTGHYSQRIADFPGTSVYSTRVDLSSLQGIRAGVSFKF